MKGYKTTGEDCKWLNKPNMFLKHSKVHKMLSSKAANLLALEFLASSKHFSACSLPCTSVQFITSFVNVVSLTSTRCWLCFKRNSGKIFSDIHEPIRLSFQVATIFHSGTIKRLTGRSIPEFPIVSRRNERAGTKKASKAALLYMDSLLLHKHRVGYGRIYMIIPLGFAARPRPIRMLRWYERVTTRISNKCTFP